jgi:hypothetical protein
MKCLTVTVDDRTLFSGEIAELQWAETLDGVSVTGKFAPSPNLLQSIQQLAQNARQQREPGVSFETRPTLDVVRDE